MFQKTSNEDDDNWQVAQQGTKVVINIKTSASKAVEIDKVSVLNDV